MSASVGSTDSERRNNSAEFCCRKSIPISLLNASCRQTAAPQPRTANSDKRRWRIPDECPNRDSIFCARVSYSKPYCTVAQTALVSAVQETTLLSGRTVGLVKLRAVLPQLVKRVANTNRKSRARSRRHRWARPPEVAKNLQKFIEADKLTSTAHVSGKSSEIEPWLIVTSKHE